MKIFVHLFDDRSGSPKILKDVIADQADSDDILFVGQNCDGWLNGCEVRKKFFCYRRFDNKLITLFFYLFSQIVLFVKLGYILIKRRSFKSKDVLYVNTMLPFAAGILGYIFNIHTIYHIHEVSIRPKILHNFLFFWVNLASNKIICVSFSQLKILGLIKDSRAVVVYNPIDNDFRIKASKNKYSYRNKNGNFNILMLSSLKKYKGIFEFLKLAEILEVEKNISFEIVLNEDEYLVKDFSFKNNKKNIKYYSRTSNTGKFYENANLVLNLSRPDLWIETFGLTIIESMAYGIPVIAPNIGGPCEIIEDGVDGYLMDSRRIQDISELILKVYNNKEKMESLSVNARNKSDNFKEGIFSEKISSVLNF